MTSEDQELLNRISQLAAQINRHKNQQAGITGIPSSSPATSHGGGPASSHRSHAPAPYHPYQRSFAPRGGYRGTGMPPAHRHRTLVLNGAGSGGADKPDGPAGALADSLADASSSTADSAGASRPGNGTWVTKNDRHMQIINSNVYEKESAARTKAIEQTRLHNRKLKDAHERAKLRNHLQYLANREASGGSGGGASGNTVHGGLRGPPGQYQISVAGIPFSVAKNGSKLVKLPGDPNPPSSTPKTAIVGGVKFYRSKNGNLYRHGVVKAQRRAGTVKKIDQPCKIFSTTGSCSKGPLCRYIHDPAKVAVCKDFLKGHCASGDNCDLSHELTAERTPFCLHYAKGNCTNPNCPYTHAQQVSSAAGAVPLVCRPFGIYGYCEQGAHCPDRHVFECPDFSNTGVCRTKGCKLPHRERASFMRRANQAGTDKDAQAEEDADLVDASSDESVHSDDVDSDEADEFVGADSDDDGNHDIAMQKDFIHF